MKPFVYQRPKSESEAANDCAAQNATFIAGGTNLLDLMKYEIETPLKLVDINHLALSQVEKLASGELKIGALVTNSDLAAHPEIIANYPVLSRALLAGASGQLRNKATTAGNLLQRTRCYYFYQIDSPCNKRVPGSGCPAIEGESRKLAILGVSDDCIAQHPSDMAVAMRVLDAKVVTQLPDGTSRTLSLDEFYRLPENTPNIETNLQSGELITHIILPPPISGLQTYDKVRDRASYAFALVSLAAIIDIDDKGNLATARLAFGGIGVMPWRNTAVEALLMSSKGERAAIIQAAEILLNDAKTTEKNAFKAPLTKRLIIQAIDRAIKAAKDPSINPIAKSY